MKYFIQSLLIILLVFSHGILAGDNVVESKQKIQELKNFLSDLARVNNPVEIQTLINNFISSDNYGDEKRYTYQKELLSDLRYQTLKQDWDDNSNTWVDFERDLFTYDGNNNLIQELEQEWDSTATAWVDVTRSTYTYDGNGNVTEYLLEMWYGMWLPFFKYFYTYDANGWIIEQVVQVGFTGTLENYWKYTSTYHAGGYPDETLKYDWESNAWDYDGKMNFSYDANWQMIEWVVLDSANVNFQKSTWAYDANGNQIEEIDLIWNGSTWVNLEKYTWTYDANNNAIGELYQTWGGSAWVNEDNYLWTYDASNNMIGELRQQWNGSAWEDFERNTLTYDGSNNCLEEIWEINWYITGWTNSVKKIHSYSPVGAIGDESDLLPNEFALSNYPNPFNPQTTITFNLPQTSTISLKIYDIAGKQIKTLIKEQKRSAGEHSVQWNGTDYNNHIVSSGIYFIQLQSEKHKNIKRCVFIK